jgi:ribosomal protein S18 acetylase RimI-like enzyme
MNELSIVRASPEDAEEILALQKLAYQSEARLYNDWSIPPLVQTQQSLQDEFAGTVFLKAMIGSRIAGSVRARTEDGLCRIGRLIVHPQYQRRGIGSRLMHEIEAAFPDAVRFELFTGSRSESNIRLYRKWGYTVSHTQPLSASVSLTFLEKLNKAGLKPSA